VVEHRSQEQRKHIFAINGSPDFLNIVRELFQEEAYNVTTTNFVPTSFDQIAMAQPDALIVDVVVGERAGWDLLEQLSVATRSHRTSRNYSWMKLTRSSSEVDCSFSRRSMRTTSRFPSRCGPGAFGRAVSMIPGCSKR
jgi:CheY-like chemotaxis protein